MSQWWLDYWSLLSRSGRAVAHDEEHLGLTFIFLLAENGDLGSLWNLSFRGRVGKVAGASVSEFVTHAGRLVIIRCRPCPRDGRVARRRETRSDKLFDSSNAGPHSTFSRGRAAFRCVRVILKVSVPDLDDSSFAPLFCTTPSAASHAPYPRSPVATRRPRCLGCPLFPEWPQWSACCLLILSHSCPVSTPHVHHEPYLLRPRLDARWDGAWGGFFAAFLALLGA